MNDPPRLAGDRENGAETWCERRGLNSQGLLRWILNPVRMPVSPLSRKSSIYCKAMNLTQLRAGGKRNGVCPAACGAGFPPLSGGRFSSVASGSLRRAENSARQERKNGRPPSRRRSGSHSKKGPPEDVPAGPGRGMRMTTRRKAVSSARPSWDRRA